MKVRLHNNNDTDSVDFEADTIEEIREQAKPRIALPWWDKWWSEEI